MACNEDTVQTLTRLECVGTQLIYQDEKGDITTIDIASKLPPNVITALSFDFPTKTLRYTDENGDINQVDLSACFPPSSYNSTLHQVTLDGVPYALNTGELQIDYLTKELVYTNERGQESRLDLSPCLPSLDVFSYNPADHSVVFNGVPAQLNVADLAFDAASCSLNYTDERGDLTTIPLPQDSYLYDAATCTLTMLPVKGPAMTIPLGAPSGQVGLTAVDSCTLEFTYKDKVCQVALANSIVGCNYSAADNTLTLIWCDGTTKDTQLAKASLVCSTLEDGTQVIAFDDGCGNSKMFNIPAVVVNIDNDSFTLVGSVLTFTSDNDTVFSYDICEVVANNCNATFTGVNPDGSWSFVDNAGDTYNSPPFPDVPVQSVCCVNSAGTQLDLVPDADGKITVPFHRTDVISPDASVTVVWNAAAGQYEITVDPQHITNIISSDSSVQIVASDTPTGNQFDITIPESTDTWGVPSISPAAGVDVYGVAYAAGDKIFTTPDGEVICIPDKVAPGNDSWGLPSVATAAGTDFFGVAYAPGDQLFTTPSGEIVCLAEKVTDTDTFAAPEFATAAGVDFYGVPYASGDQLVRYPGGSVVCIPAKTTPSGDTVNTTTSSDSSVTITTSPNAQGGVEYDLSVEHPEYLDKNGNAITDGATLLQPLDFANSGVVPPAGAVILAFGPDGDCVGYLPPAGMEVPEFTDKDGTALPDGTALVQLSDFVAANVALPATAQILGLDANGDCALYDPPAGLTVPVFKDKDDADLVGGETLLQPDDFTAAGVVPPATAQLLAFDADGNCVSYIPPTTTSASSYTDKDGATIANGAQIMQLSDFADAAADLPGTAKILAVDENGDCMLFDPSCCVEVIQATDPDDPASWPADQSDPSLISIIYDENDKIIGVVDGGVGRAIKTQAPPEAQILVQDADDDGTYTLDLTVDGDFDEVCFRITDADTGQELTPLTTVPAGGTLTLFDNSAWPINTQGTFDADAYLSDVGLSCQTLLFEAYAKNTVCCLVGPALVSSVTIGCPGPTSAVGSKIIAQTVLTDADFSGVDKTAPAATPDPSVTYLGRNKLQSESIASMHPQLSSLIDTTVGRASAPDPNPLPTNITLADLKPGRCVLAVSVVYNVRGSRNSVGDPNDLAPRAGDNDVWEPTFAESGAAGLLGAPTVISTTENISTVAHPSRRHDLWLFPILGAGATTVDMTSIITQAGYNPDWVRGQAAWQFVEICDVDQANPFSQTATLQNVAVDAATMTQTTADWEFAAAPDPECAVIAFNASFHTDPYSAYGALDFVDTYNGSGDMQTMTPLNGWNVGVDCNIGQTVHWLDAPAASSFPVERSGDATVSYPLAIIGQAYELNCQQEGGPGGPAEIVIPCELCITPPCNPGPDGINSAVHYGVNIGGITINGAPGSDFEVALCVGGNRVGGYRPGVGANGVGSLGLGHTNLIAPTAPEQEVCIQAELKVICHAYDDTGTNEIIIEPGNINAITVGS